MQDDSAGPAPRRAVLAGQEADHRKAVLTRLQEVLAVHGLESVLAARHILVLRGAGPAQPSGPGDPELHILGAGRRQVITTTTSAMPARTPPMTPAEQPAASCSLTYTRTGTDISRPHPPITQPRGETAS